MKYVQYIIKHIEAIISGAAMGLMIVLTCTNVILRFVFHGSSVAISEITVICMSWAVFLGAAEAYKQNQHFGMDFLPNHLSPKLRMLLRQFITLVLLVFFVMMSYWGFKFALTTMKKTAFLMLSYAWIDLPVGLGFLSMSIHALIYLVESIASPAKFAQRYADQDALSGNDAAIETVGEGIEK